MQKTFFKVSDFIAWQKAKTLKLAPEFQRRAVWRPGAKSFLIDTIVRDLPIPIIFLRDRRSDTRTLEPQREVVDGQQRLRTVIVYIAPKFLEDFDEARDPFTVKQVHNAELAGKTFTELDDAKRQAILDYEFSVHVLPSNMDDREVIQIFRRMNSTSYALNKQELRNAEYYGEFKTCVYELAAEQLHRWRRWGTFGDGEISRMAEVELTSECVFSFIEQKIGGRLSKRLDVAYKHYDDKLPGRANMEARFRSVFEEIDKHFGAEAGTLLFLERRAIYVFILFLYDKMFGLNSAITKRKKPRHLSNKELVAVREASDKIEKQKAPKAVIEATQKHTNDLKERQALFKFLHDQSANA